VSEPGEVGPLHGIRVVDLAPLAPGAYATLLLGDLGADVVSVSAPASRRVGSDVTAVPTNGGRAARSAGIHPSFRSRRSIVVDLKRPAGLEVVLRLVDRADVFVEGFRPGVCGRLGLGFEDLAQRNDRLVYCSITGYGQNGPLAQRPGHDLTYLAEAGVLSLTADGEHAPRIPMNLLADVAAGGMVSAIGILAALRGRDLTGRGSHVDVSMLEGLLSMSSVQAAWFESGAPDASWGGGLTTGAAPFYDCYRTSDHRWIALAAVETKFFREFCEAVDRPDLHALQLDPERWEELRFALTQLFASESLQHWLNRLPGSPVAEVRSLPEGFAQAAKLGLVRDTAVVGPLPRISGFGHSVGDVVRDPDQHRHEILAEIGLDVSVLDEEVSEREGGTLH
jgi:alpha-methylacyl-CoA racemase